ncbi:hypothetical protein DEU56DRAFT_773987 [Suillus clintonianus]|uniref:uncharacterized protein n=1 Tax=Suillus clintonianus TaxID=1904413 RepID=UPI001B8724E2|nr:uncharacterized protein DEU56DRAFT_773987 [Suillus clintonianus]KAG2153256.1 hypothetical protein DEU56DRAFT_773987 [Suillus clintonianus]
MEVDSQHAETSAAGAKRQRLSPEARKLLKDFADHVSMNPDSFQRQLLLDQVRRLSGCGHVDSKHITTWFPRYRATVKKNSMKNDDNILFPNFTSEQLEVLRPLLRNNPLPRKEMIDIWAACIKAVPEQVSQWVLYHQAKAAPLRETSEQSMSVSPTAPLPHLPTPARSLSPVRARGMSLPLIATKEERSPSSPLLDTWPTSPVSHASLAQEESADVLDELNPPFTRKPSSEGSRSLRDNPATVPSSAMPVQLAKDINHVMTSHDPARKRPSTHAEFDAMFKPYEEMMTQFFHNVESGKLQHLGWEPSEFAITWLVQIIETAYNQIYAKQHECITVY